MALVGVNVHLHTSHMRVSKPNYGKCNEIKFVVLPTCQTRLLVVWKICWPEISVVSWSVHTP